MSLFSGPPIPFHRLGIVLRHALTEGIHDTEIVLCPRLALRRRPPKPFHRLGIVLRHALTEKVQGAEHGLRASVALFSRRSAGNELSCRCQISLEAVGDVNVLCRNGTRPYTDPQQGDASGKPKRKFHGDTLSWLPCRSSPGHTTYGTWFTYSLSDIKSCV